jgi:hypothetical protein
MELISKTITDTAGFSVHWSKIHPHISLWDNYKPQLQIQIL